MKEAEYKYDSSRTWSCAYWRDLSKMKNIGTICNMKVYTKQNMVS